MTTTRTGRLARLLPGLALLIGLALSAVTADGAREGPRERREEGHRRLARAAARHLEADASTLAATLARMEGRRLRGGGSWVADAADLLDDLEGLASLAVLDHDGRPLVEVKRAQIGLLPEDAPVLRELVRGDQRVACRLLDEHRLVFVVRAPSASAECLAATLEAEPYFASRLVEDTLGIELGTGDKRLLVRAPAPSSGREETVTTELVLPGLNLVMTTSLGTQHEGERPDTLPLLVFALGTVASALLAWTLACWLRARDELARRPPIHGGPERRSAAA